MQAYLSKFRIGPRLTYGFGTVLLLLVVTALVAGLGLYTAYTSFEDYRATARETKGMAEYSERMLTARIANKDVYLDGREDRMAVVVERVAAAQRLIDDAKGYATDPERQAELREIEGLLQTYATAFTEMRGHVTANNAQYDELRSIGDTTTAAMEALIDKLQATGDTEALLLAVEAEIGLATARIGVMRQMSTNGADGSNEIDRGLTTAFAAQERLVGRLVGSLRAEAERITAGVGDYRAVADAMIDTLAAKANAAATLDEVGMEMSDRGRVILNDLAEEQDTLGPLAQGRIVTSLMVAVVVALVSIVVGVVAARLIAASITRPLGAMTGAMEKIADGELETEVPSRDAKDEMGDLAGALEVFKQNAIEREKLEKAQAERVKKMDKAIKSFDAEVNVALGAVDGASTQLGDSATTMVAAAGQ
ncbi:MAG: HAMP domain-containing protein, partial [Pseudomonadota bacterium]